MKPILPAGRARTAALVLLPLMVALALSLAGCGGGGGSSTPPVSSVSLGYYYLTASGLLPITARVGDQVQLLATGHTSSGEVSLTDQVTWASGNSAVATVDVTGMLTATSPGATQITATYKSLTSDPLSVTVNAVGATPTAAYYPFAVGKEWLYTGTEVVPAQAAPPVTLSIATQDQVVLEGLVWWELQINYSDPKIPPGYMYLRHDEQGLRQVIYVRLGSNTVPQYSYRLREPLAAGNHWVDPARAEHYWDLVSTTATITVPAGTYSNCFQVREHDVTAEGTAFNTNAWFASGEGLVKTATNVPSDPSQNSHQDLLRTQFIAPAAAALRR